ncbi:hypothetical protein BDA96_02G086700 [Sorghum bicolor]|uniref:Uncharacterized protein n=2 Tax=Sorghum bicolor TaxID=4558 RepID=A0A921URU2_SORBI|nr:hypothetical protein BDA96_02G086700 [Sorghum bicolor]OQU88739.1 hypothetical protein SORBI_3002G083332 [Sorghum bicolor]
MLLCTCKETTLQLVAGFYARPASSPVSTQHAHKSALIADLTTQLLGCCCTTRVQRWRLLKVLNLVD